MNEETLAQKIAEKITPAMKEHAENILHSTYNEGKGKSMSAWGREWQKTNDTLNQTNKTLEETIEIVGNNTKAIEGIKESLAVEEKVKERSFFRKPVVIGFILTTFLGSIGWVIVKVYAQETTSAVLQTTVSNNTQDIKEIKTSILNIDNFIRNLK